MPGILVPASRRQFLKTTAVAGGALALGLGAAASDASDDRVRLALLSDTHIPEDPAETYRGFRMVDNLRRIVPEILAAAPDGALLNGDAARLTGRLEDYRQLHALLAPLAEAMPVTIGLGNHDDRRQFFAVFPAAAEPAGPVADKHVVALEYPAVRILVLDSLLYVDRTAGLLGKAQRGWLEGYLRREDARPVALVVHHTLGDGDGDLLDVDRLFRLMAPSRRVKAIFYGHSHQYRYDVREGVHLVNVPAVGYNFSDREPVGWVYAAFRPDGVDLTLRAFGGNTAGDGETTRLDWMA